jgi:hypothetical protein
MPTDDTNASQKDEKPTGTPNAEETGKAAFTEDDVKSHPLYQEAKKRESDARKKMDESTIEAKKLRSEIARLKTLAGEEEEDKEEKKETPAYLTKDEYERGKFEIMNSEKISLNEDGYKSYLEKGYDPSDALRLSHLDKGITQENMSEHMRQAQSSQSGQKVDRSGGEIVSPEEEETMKLWGFSKETYLKHKDAVLKRR